MKISTQRWMFATAGFATASAMFVGQRLLAAEAPAAVVARTAFSEKLPNVPGKTLTGVLVTYQAGGKSQSHQHPGSVYAYVLSGEIRSENSVTGPARIYRSGEGFFEPPGSVHTVSENASVTEPASLLAIFVADDGAQLSRAAPQK